MKDIRLSNKNFFIRVTCFMFWLVTCPSSLGQANQKRLLTTEDYKLWSNLIPRNLSEYGNWSEYLLQYPSRKDTLFVQHNTTGKRYAFPLGRDGRFNAELEFGCITGDTLILQNLRSGVLRKIPHGQALGFSADHRFTVLILKRSDGKYNLEIIDDSGNLKDSIMEVTNWHFDPAGNGILYSTKSADNCSIGVFQLKGKIVKKTILQASKSPFISLAWKENHVAFIKNEAEHMLLYTYDIKLKKLYALDPTTAKGFPLDMTISDNQANSPILSKDGTRLIFWLKNKGGDKTQIDPNAVQIWNANDRVLFDYKKSYGDIRYYDKMASWSVEQNVVLPIQDKELTQGFLSSDYRHAFIYDRTAYEPQNNLFGPYDLYILDLESGVKKCIVKEYSSEKKPAGSPDGKYLCYVKDGHWWVYDIKKESHTNLTHQISESFFREDNNIPDEKQPYGIGGWTKNGSVILYDRFDLWLMPLDGQTAKRLTKERETNVTFRLREFSSDPMYGSDTESKKCFLDLEKGFIIEAVNKDTGNSGLFRWNAKTGLSQIVWKNKKINQLIKAQNKDIYLYLEQNFESPPRLMLFDGKEKEILQSNVHQKHFYWSKNQPIEYDVNGVKTKGILFYPADYKAGMKYPLLVHIYERQFAYLNDYENPSEFSPDGFNVNHIATKGYFILYPDIQYKFGNLAQSVTQSVLSAVDKVLTMGMVDPAKVGLMGHSFGGYETDLIITQTDRFAAAVSGAAWTDLVSCYLYVSGTSKRPDFYRAEKDQLRIGKSLYEDTESYLKNSPVLLAQNVKTPLLGWTGENDRHIHSFQSMEFYLALRRLNKEHTLLVYPGEGHQLDQKQNRKDLTNRILEWFDYYLKNGDRKDWMNADR
ncbi:S9 family peptidase [Flavobacterium sp. 2]|uniref:S9 family peptidase n=1 Tax=Flavobacterium sp. 2 TaxID=308053 RepID=UPI003CF56E6C